MQLRGIIGGGGIEQKRKRTYGQQWGDCRGKRVIRILNHNGNKYNKKRMKFMKSKADFLRRSKVDELLDKLMRKKRHKLPISEIREVSTDSTDFKG